MTAYERKWEKGFVALTRFKAREGHCCVPRRYIAGTYHLGTWVTTQRSSEWTISADRKRRLNKIGFVWDGREFTWERGFAALTKYKAREGHCLVPRFYVEGKNKLGKWVSVQRYKGKNIEDERKQRLNKIGFVWDWREYTWGKGFAALTKFKKREGHCLVPAQYIDQKFKLGQWVTVQRRSKNKMSAKRRKRLNVIGFVWRAI